MRCKACDYPLTNLAEHRCPECGRAFDLANPKTFRGEPKEPSRWIGYVMLMLVALMILWCAFSVTLIIAGPVNL